MGIVLQFRAKKPRQLIDLVEQQAIANVAFCAAVARLWLVLLGVDDDLPK